MTFEREANELLARVREASLPEDVQLTRVRAALLSQLGPGYPAPAHPPSNPGSPSHGTAKVALGKWKLGGLLGGALVLAGLTGAVLQERASRTPAALPHRPPSEATAKPPSVLLPQDAKSAVVSADKRVVRARTTKARISESARTSDLDAQVELLARAVGALRVRDHDEARRLLDLHASLYPDSLLLPERQSAAERLHAAEQAQQSTGDAGP